MFALLSLVFLLLSLVAEFIYATNRQIFSSSSEAVLDWQRKPHFAPLPQWYESTGATYEARKDQFKDVSFIVDAVAIKCHKMVLCEYPYFEAILTKTIKESTETKIVFDEDLDTFKQMIEFIYLKKIFATSVDQVLAV